MIRRARIVGWLVALGCLTAPRARGACEDAAGEYLSEHWLDRSFTAALAELGIAYDAQTSVEHMLDYETTFSHHNVMVKRSYRRRDLLTEVYTVEGRPGLPQSLVASLDRDGRWPRHPDGRLLGVRPKSFAESLSAPVLHAEHPRLAAELEARLQSAANQGNAEWLAAMREILVFVSGEYQRRDWGKDFEPTLQRDALFYAVQSTYIVVRQAVSGEIVGTLRLIRAPFGMLRLVHKKTGRVAKEISGSWGSLYKQASALNPHEAGIPDLEFISRDESIRRFKPDHSSLLVVPAEDKIGSKLSREVPVWKVVPGELLKGAILFDGDLSEYEAHFYIGEVIEPGVFALRKDMNAEAYVQVVVQLMAFTLDPHYSLAFNQRNRLYYTYNDKPRLYTMLGFLLTGQEFDYANHHWQVLRGTGADLMGQAGRLVTKLKDADPAFLEEAKRGFDQLMDAMRATAR